MCVCGGLTREGGRQLAGGQHLLHHVAPRAAVPQQVGGGEGQVELPDRCHSPRRNPQAATSSSGRAPVTQNAARGPRSARPPLPQPISAQQRSRAPAPRPIAGSLPPPLLRPLA